MSVFGRNCWKLFYLIFFVIFIGKCWSTSLKNCSMRTVKPIIERAIESAGLDAPLQMQIIRRIIEDIYGGSWGVLIIKDPQLVSSAVHWTIPDHKHEDGSPAFCLYVKNGWQYNVFKTGNVDTENRLTVEDVVKKLRESKQRLAKFTVTEFDQRIAQAFRRRRRLRNDGNAFTFHQ